MTYRQRAATLQSSQEMVEFNSNSKWKEDPQEEGPVWYISPNVLEPWIPTVFRVKTGSRICGGVEHIAKLPG